MRYVRWRSVFLRGTDSIWWGSPQWQIEAFRRLETPEDLQKRFGFKPLSDKVKEKISA